MQGLWESASVVRIGEQPLVAVVVEGRDLPGTHHQAPRHDRGRRERQLPRSLTERSVMDARVRPR